MSFLRLENVHKYFGTFKAVQNFELAVERGEFVSFLGPSGCGKTTTLRMIAGFELPSEGRVFIGKKDVTDMPPQRRNTGMVFQAYALFPNMTVADNIGFGLRVAHRGKDEIKARVAEMLALIKMENFGHRYPYQLSGGQQQRVALARALAIRPEVLLLDEPLSALDAKIRLSLRQEIRGIQRELGITTIYVTHDQEEALSLSDRVVVMNAGRIEQIGTPFEIYNFPQTGFTAQFVGTLNNIQATVRDRGRGTLSVDEQEVQTAHTLDEMHNGDAITVAIRPERIDFAVDGAKSNVLNVKVENITFLGSIVRVQIRAGDHSFYMDTFNNPFLTLPKVGEIAQVAFPKEAVLVLKHS